MEIFFLWVLLELDPDASGWNLSWDVFFLADEFSPFFSSSEMNPWTFSLLLEMARTFFLLLLRSRRLSSPHVLTSQIFLFLLSATGSPEVFLISIFPSLAL